MSDNVLIVNALLTFLSTCFTGVMAFLIAKLNRGQITAATKVDEAARIVAVQVENVKQAVGLRNSVLDGKLVGLAQIAQSTHILVNSSFAAQLRISALALRRIAAMTGHSDDIEAADVAERLHREHEQKQYMIDAKDAKDAKDA